MKKFVFLILIASLLFAVKRVPRTEGTNDEAKSKVKVETVQHKENKKQTDSKERIDKKKDHFKDADSDGINDQREDDFQKIKQLKKKPRDVKRKTVEKKKSSEKSSKTKKKKSR